MDKKVIAIVILSAACLVLGYLAFKPVPEPIKDTYADVRLDTLKAQYGRLEAEKIAATKEAEHYKSVADSLGSIPEKIKIKYVPIYEKINNSGVNSVISGFDTIFSNAGLNRR